MAGLEEEAQILAVAVVVELSQQVAQPIVTLEQEAAQAL
jgi:hypothetical protein